MASSPTRETCSRTRAQIQPISPQNSAGTGFNWENIRSGNSWLLLWQLPTREIAGLGAGMVTAGTTRWVPGDQSRCCRRGAVPWDCPRIRGRSPELMAPPSQHSQPPRSRLALVTVVMPSVPPLLLSPCLGTGPCIVPRHEESSSQPRHWETPQGMRIRDHQGGSRRRRTNLDLTAPAGSPRGAEDPSGGHRAGLTLGEPQEYM